MVSPKLLSRWCNTKNCGGQCEQGQRLYQDFNGSIILMAQGGPKGLVLMCVSEGRSQLIIAKAVKYLSNSCIHVGGNESEETRQCNVFFLMGCDWLKWES